MTTPRVTPWQDEEPVDANLLNAIKACRTGGKLTGIDRVLLKSDPLAASYLRRHVPRPGVRGRHICSHT